jgi:hypothetical protein
MSCKCVVWLKVWRNVNGEFVGCDRKLCRINICMSSFEIIRVIAMGVRTA